MKKLLILLFALLPVLAYGQTITVSPAAPTGRTVTPQLWGFATGSMLGNNGGGYADLMGNSTFQTSIASLKPTLIRFNALETEAIFAQCFASGVGNPNWSCLTNYLNNQASFPNVRWIWGIGPNGTDTSLSPATWASYATAIANELKSTGHEVFYWEVGNENDGMGATTYLTYFNAIAAALHAVNSTYLVGGPVTTYNNGFATGGGGSLTSFANGATGLGYIVYHAYENGSGANPNYATALASTDVSGARTLLAGTPYANAPITLLEYNVDSSGANTQMQGIQGAIWEALGIITRFNQDPSFTMTALWDLTQDSKFGAIGGGGSPLSSIDPQGWLLGRLGQYVSGTQIAVTTTHANELALATGTTNSGALVVTNYSTSTAQTENIAVTGINASSTFSEWVLSPASLTGTVSFPANISSVAVPANSSVIITWTPESSAGTTVPPALSINASPTPGSAGSGNVITITGGAQVAVNGVTISNTAGVTELYYTGVSPGANGATAHTAYQMNNAGNWYGPIISGNGGSQVSTPVPSSVSNGVSDLSNTGAHPVTGFPASKIAYSIQNYPTNVTTATPDSGATAITIWNTYFGYLVKNNTVPVVNLNTGCSCDGSNSNLADDQAWGSTWDSYANGTAANGPTFPPPKQSMSNSWWFWGNAAANPDGTLNANGTINASQLTYWAPLLMPLVQAGKQPMFMVLQ